MMQIPLKPSVPRSEILELKNSYSRCAAKGLAAFV